MRDNEKRKKWMRESLANRRKEGLTGTGPSKTCGSWERLEVDHIDPAQKIHHAVWSWAPERRVKELAKCQPLCYDCHKEKTKEYVKSLHPIQHGSSSGYGRGCKCEKCLAYQKNRMERYHELHSRSRVAHHKT